MNATDLVIAPPGRLFSRTSPRVRRTEKDLSFGRRGLSSDALVGSAAPQPLGLSASCACALALQGDGGQVYNEEAFRYFLSVERKRKDARGSHLLLALVDLKKPPAVDEPDAPDAALHLFKALRSCLRETDFVGWYRENELAGAVLPQFRGSSVNTSTRRVGERISQGLAGRLPAPLARWLEVHVYEVPAVDPS